MAFLKKIYVYWFCAIYKSFEKLGIEWGLDFRTTSFMGIMELFIINFFFGCYLLYTRRFVESGNPLLFLIPIAVGIGVIKYLIFYQNNKWKSYLKIYNYMPKRKKITIFVLYWILNLIIIMGTIFIFVKIYNINWINPPLSVI